MKDCPSRRSSVIERAVHLIGCPLETGHALTIDLDHSVDLSISVSAARCTYLTVQPDQCRAKVLEGWSALFAIWSEHFFNYLELFTQLVREVLSPKWPENALDNFETLIFSTLPVRQHLYRPLEPVIEAQVIREIFLRTVCCLTHLRLASVKVFWMIARGRG